MADVLYYSRDTKFFVEIGSDIWELPILEGFSFSQGTNTTEAALNEAADPSGNTRRSRKMFTDSYAPAEWSITTYVRPFISAADASAGVADTAANHHAVEEVLWAMFVGSAAYSGATFPGFTGDLTDLDIDFSASNKVTLGTANFYFALGACDGVDPVVYKLDSSVVNEASIDFDLDGIASINWSGFASIISEVATIPTATIYEAISDTGNFIRNKLTSLVVETDGSGNFETAYDLTLTGGNITFNNNISFLTPEELCVVNQPIGHITGTRTVSGNFTCYLGMDNAGGVDTSSDLFEDIVASTSLVTNEFDLTFVLGGTGNTPRMEVNVPQAHMELPSHSIDTIISIDANFHGLSSTEDATDEATIKYVGAA